MPSGDGALQDNMTGLIHLIGKLKEHRKTIVNSMGAYYWLGGGLETGAPPAEERRRRDWKQPTPTLYIQIVVVYLGDLHFTGSEAMFYAYYM